MYNHSDLLRVFILRTMVLCSSSVYPLKEILIYPDSSPRFTYAPIFVALPSNCTNQTPQSFTVYKIYGITINETIPTWGSPPRQSAIAHTRELLPEPFGPMTRFNRDPGLHTKWLKVMKLWSSISVIFPGR